MAVNNLHIMYYANSYLTMILQRCWLQMSCLRTALYWQRLLDSSTQSLSCSTLYKIIAPIFKFINFEDDFKSFKLLFGVN